MSFDVIEGDCLAVMAELGAESIDTVVTDPPYGLEFMGKEWDRLARTPGYNERGRITERPDSQVPYGRGGGVNSYQAGRPMQEWHEAWAREALRLLKPGGHLVAFGGTRTFHRLTCAIEDAGFEIRDCLSWLYGSGFPKSHNLSGEWEGFGTALKPAWEPIILARKPLAGTVAANVLEHGTGALNVDGCRLDVADADYARNHSGDRGHAGTRSIEEQGATDLRPGGGSAAAAGRWPANVALDDEAAELLDEQSGTLASGANPTRRGSDKLRTAYGDFEGQRECEPARGVDVGGASRFFYCAKAARSERNAGLDGFEVKMLRWSSGDQSPGTFQSEGTEKRAANHHPTVKPLSLMRWLCRLVTPPGGLILDPFTGSGTTGIAAVLEGFDFIGIEREREYAEIARARLAHWAAKPVQLGLEVAA